ncbi:MAG: FG-GAP repeat protein [Saprospiraceae bacterium]
MRNFLLFILMFLMFGLVGQNTISGSYAGNIPTSFSTYDEGCNGPSAEFSITLPAGESYQITGINITYNMTAIGEGFKLDQRSKIRCVNTGIEEPEYAGIGATTGVQSYNRPGVGIANGTYAGGTIFTFQFWGRRTYEASPGCNQLSNYASNLSITIVYSNQIIVSKAGVNRTNPMNTLDVNGKLRVGDDSSLPTAGSIRWNAASHDFEGYNGTEWVSFTKSNGSAKYGMTLSEPDRTFETGCIFNSFGIEENWLILGCDEANISGGSSNNSGMVTPFYKTGDSWTAQNSFVPPDNIPGDRFGTDLAITSNELLVSATGAAGASGRVYYYHYNGLFWALVGSFSPPDVAAGDRFGSVIVIDRNRAYISSPYKNVGGNAGAGKVYVYFFNGTSWVWEAELTAPVPAINDEFGYSLDAAWPHLIIGCPKKDHSGFIDKGQAYLMKNVSNNWYLLNTFQDVTGNNEESFGFSVAIDENDLAISAPFKTVNNNTYAGQVYNYHRTNYTWNSSGTLINPSVQANYGYSLDLQNNYLAVGNPGVLAGAGQVILYGKTNGSDWKEVQKIKNSLDINLAINFGYYLKLRKDQLFIASIYSVNFIKL